MVRLFVSGMLLAEDLISFISNGTTTVWTARVNTSLPPSKLQMLGLPPGFRSKGRTHSLRTQKHYLHLQYLLNPKQNQLRVLSTLQSHYHLVPFSTILALIEKRTIPSTLNMIERSWKSKRMSARKTIHGVSQVIQGSLTTSITPFPHLTMTRNHATSFTHSPLLHEYRNLVIDPEPDPEYKTWDFDRDGASKHHRVRVRNTSKTFFHISLDQDSPEKGKEVKAISISRGFYEPGDDDDLDDNDEPELLNIMLTEGDSEVKNKVRSLGTWKIDEWRVGNPVWELVTLAQGIF
ncbi:hypothetical protein BGZ57DRAFT_908966, partial [Hyaloscypha finlandica]